jgi:hypothetical protein
MVKCPWCNTANVRKSKRGNARLMFPLSLCVVSIRCNDCGRRFQHYGFLPGRRVSENLVPIARPAR